MSADTAKPSASGLHIHAAPFVPGPPKPEPKPAASKAGPQTAHTSLNGSAGNSRGAAAAAAQGQTPDKAADDKAGPAPGITTRQQGSSGGGGSAGGAAAKGGGSKGGGKQAGGSNSSSSSNTPGAASKLAAAALAAPFVPTGSGTSKPSSGGGAGGSNAAAAPGQQQQQQPAAQDKGKQQGKGKGKQQQQQQKDQKTPAKDSANSSGNNNSSGGGSSGGGDGSKDPKLLAAAKMSPTAAAFVPKTVGPAGSTPTAAAAAAAAAAVAASEALKGPGALQQQQQQQHKGGGSGAASGGGAGTANRNLKSPTKVLTAAAGGSGAGAASGSSGAAVAGPSPNRLGGNSSSNRGCRGGGRLAGESGSQGMMGARGPNSMGGGGSAGAGSYAGVGSSSCGGLSGSGPGAAAGGGGNAWGSSGMAAAAAGVQAGGPGKWGLLAQYQGSYGPMYAMGGYGGGYGHGGGGYGAHHHHHHPHPHHMGAPAKQLLSAQFMPEGLRQQLQQSNYLVQLQYTPSADEPPLPDKVCHYHTLYPLEDLAAAEAAGVSAAWGVRTTCLKAISSRDGHAYCLRVVCGKQVIPSLEMLGVVRGAVEAWSSLTHHPGLLVPLEGFVASELDGSPSLVVATSFVPGAVTLAQAHLQPTQTGSGQLVRNTPSEEVLWGYTTQLAAVLRAAHSMGLALRPATLSATKVLVTPVGRLKVCGLGVSEALAGEVVPTGADELLQLQRDDVVAMGQLLLQLACAVGGLPSPSLDFAHAHYSPEFVRLLMLLLGVAEGGAFSWRAVSALLGERLLLDMDTLAIFNEQLLDALTHEMENGRLFRLVSKLAFVTDRQATSDVGAAAGDTGNPYLLQLFRDFVFHQGERDGGRLIDWGHIVENLNKLDAGVSEQVLLQSRDERSLLVVSYADIKRCVESAVSEIRTRGAGGPGGGQAGSAGGVGMMRPPAVGAHMYNRGMR